MRGERGIGDYVPIILVMVIWGSMGIPSTYAVKEFSPLAIICLRSGIAAVVLFPFVRRRHESIKPGKNDGWLLVLLSFIGIVLCNYLYFFAVRHTALTNVAILYALGPIITTVLAALLLKEKVHQSRTVGILLAFVGAAALITDGKLGQLFLISFNRGDIAELVSALCLAVYTILSRKLKNTPADCAVFWLMLIGFAMTLPMVFLMEGGLSLSVSWKALASIAYLGILCSGMGYLLQQISIKSIGASTSAAFLNGISPITILTAAIILKEEITPMQMCCMAVVFFGLFLNAENKTF